MRHVGFLPRQLRTPLITQVEKLDQSFKSRIHNILFKPFIMVAHEPMLAAIILYQSVVYGIMYLLVRYPLPTKSDADESVSSIPVRLCRQSRLQPWSKWTSLPGYLWWWCYLYDIVSHPLPHLVATDKKLHDRHRT